MDVELPPEPVALEHKQPSIVSVSPEGTACSRHVSIRPSPYFVPVVFSPVSKPREESEEKCYACITGSEEKPVLADALERMGLTVFYSSDGKKIPDYVPDECDMVFICDMFEGEVFDYLHSRKLRILGPPCVLSCAERNEPLPNSIRPIYNNVMKDVVVCFTGFKHKKDIQTVCSLAHNLGASVRGEVTSAVTHIVAHTVGGSKYKDGVARGTAIMSESWITECWERKDEVGLSATDPAFNKHKQLPFTGCVMRLHGFPAQEEQHMKEIASDNGAKIADKDSSSSEYPVSHLVVCDQVDVTSIPPTSSRVYVVKQQWFWESIQIDACADERLYLAKESHRRTRSRRSLNSSLYTSINSLDISCLLEASLFSLASPSVKATLGKREHKQSPRASPLISTPSSIGTAASSSSRSGPDTARRHIVSELLQTEKNFVNILSIIVNVFKEPLERPQQRGGPILGHEDIKSIFANIPEILAVHQALVSGLEEQLSQWSETSCIGQVLLQQCEGFLRVYPPFVNFFDMSKEALHKCDKLYPRFHAFLKSNESRAECSRQTLAELLITPVQRIPRIILLIQDLVKHTEPSHPDLDALQKTVDSLKNVMTHINEDRRKTEGQMQMFEVLRDVEGCPATVLSAQRSFLRRLDVLDIGNPSKATKGEPLAIFLFTDSMEVAKRRPASNFALRNSTHKSFKHIEFVPFIHVRSIVHFGDTGDFSQSFGVLVRWPDDPQEKLLVFRLIGDETSKTEVVEQLAKLLASINFSTDHSHFVMCSSPDILNSMMKCTNVSSRTLKRALHGARKKVKRAFSGRQTRRMQLASISHQNLHQLSLGEENEMAMDIPIPESPNTSIGSSCSAATVAFTPVASLKTPRAKRFALSSVPSFSSADLSNIGTEV